MLVGALVVADLPLSLHTQNFAQVLQNPHTEKICITQRNENCLGCKNKKNDC